MKNDIKFRLAAACEAAGKYAEGAFRNGNEDNFYLNQDLSVENAGDISSDSIVDLGPKGMLMVVADGMGGMNAGEVASQIAVDTVAEAFNPRSLTPEVIDNAESRGAFMKKVISLADERIREDSLRNNEHYGMGSTIIMAWLFGNELTVCWCGDSRAYVYNDEKGIMPVSHDHSYVQGLADAGLITYEQTFDHPQNNIITRSLGDPSKDAVADSITINVGKGDIILLCSDGLSGMLRDRPGVDNYGNPYKEESLENVINKNSYSMEKCLEALFRAAEKADWYDNVTCLLCQIIDGPKSKWSKELKYPGKVDGGKKSLLDKKIILIALAVIILLTGIGLWLFFGLKNEKTEEVKKADKEKVIEKPIEKPVLEVPQTEKEEPNTGELVNTVVKNENPQKLVDPKKDSPRLQRETSPLNTDEERDKLNINREESIDKNNLHESILDNKKTTE